MLWWKRNKAKTLVVQTDPNIGMSGTFATWFAAEVLRAEKIYLLGFGGAGHFHGPDRGNEEKGLVRKRNRDLERLLARYPQTEHIA